MLKSQLFVQKVVFLLQNTRTANMIVVLILTSLMIYPAAILVDRFPGKVVMHKLMLKRKLLTAR